MVFARTLQVKRFVGLKIILYPSDTVSPITLVMPTTDKTVSCLRKCQKTAPLTLPEKKKNPFKHGVLFAALQLFSKTYRSAWLRQLEKIDTIFQKYLYSASRCASSPLHTFTIIKLTAQVNICLERTWIDESRFFSSVNEALKPTETVSW